VKQSQQSPNKGERHEENLGQAATKEQAKGDFEHPMVSMSQDKATYAPNGQQEGHPIEDAPHRGNIAAHVSPPNIDVGHNYQEQ
jgi:hypothetical protein